jgi:hypothetical protein
LSEQPIPGSVKPSVAAVANAVRELGLLVDEHLPQSFSGPTDTWQLLGTAMIARMADMIESVVVLMGTYRAVEGAVLVRVLYEAVVKFCWISIDPDTNYPRWQGDTDYWEHRLRRDLHDYELERVTEEELAEYAAAPQMPPIPDMAIAADKHWGGRIVGFQPYSKGRAGMFTLRGYYAPIYRTLSEAVHARPETLARANIDTSGPWRVIRNGPVEHTFWWPLPVPLFAQALLVCHEEWGWPDPNRVRAVNNAMYDV